MKRPQRRRETRDPWTNERREPLELLAMLAGGTAFKIPVEGRSTAQVRMTAADVAHAIAVSPNKLGAAMAMAMVTESPKLWPEVRTLGYGRIVDELERQRIRPGVIAGDHRHRARIGMRAAFDDLVNPKGRVPLAVLASQHGIDENAFAFIHKHCTAFLQSEAASAAADGWAYIFTARGFSSHAPMAPHIPRARRPHSAIVESPSELPATSMKPAPTIRRYGLLRLKGGTE
jgi:hypothetical protein